jgi:catechol 2,3-dioxygenase-like lactoylglutathione lyase family enzyme
MIDHTGLTVSDIEKAERFYQAALAPLGYAVMMSFQTYRGLGVAPKMDFWLGQGQPNPPVHIAFRAANRAQVDAFYKAAMAAGGRDNGPPGTRPHYHQNYYGAFVLDPDGYNIEAVCHEAP